MAEGSWSATKKFVHDRAGGFCEYCQTFSLNIVEYEVWKAERGLTSRFTREDDERETNYRDEGRGI